MTQLSPNARTGKIDFPYNPKIDNTYADGQTRKNTQQCIVTIWRIGDARYEAYVGYGDSISFSSGVKDLNNDGDYLTVMPPPGNLYEPLKVMRMAPLGTGDGSRVLLFYAMNGNTMTDSNRYFAWDSQSIGADDTMNQKKKDWVTSDVKGRYCW